MSVAESGALVNVLMIEDNPGDIRLAQEAFKTLSTPVQLYVARDGEAAMAILDKVTNNEGIPRPDLILLDLNLPKKNGLEVLLEIKRQPALKSIPVIVLSTSTNPDDVKDCYDHYANCFVSKPDDIAVLQRVINQIDEFWFSVARLPEV